MTFALQNLDRREAENNRGVRGKTLFLATAAWVYRKAEVVGNSS
jgi:hypothetical protein